MWFNPGDLLKNKDAPLANPANFANYDSKRDESSRQISRLAELADHSPEKATLGLSMDDERHILKWLAHIGADDGEINGVLNRCRSDLEAREYFLSRAAKRGNVIPFPVKKGFTRCYTPNGNPIDIEPTSPEHADFLRKMNPKPETSHD